MIRAGHTRAKRASIQLDPLDICASLFRPLGVAFRYLPDVSFRSRLHGWLKSSARAGFRW